MGFRINANRVRVRHGKCSLQNQGLSILAKNGHIPGFCRDIQPMESRVEREYVRVSSYWVRGQYLHVGEIDHCKLVVILSRYKGQSSGHVEGNPVRALYSSHCIAPDNLGGCRVNRHKFVLFVDGNEDVAGARIIDGVARTAAERDCGDKRVGRRIDHRIRVSVLVGHEDPLRAGSVGDSVRIFDWSGLSDSLEGLHIDNGNFVFPSGRRVHSAQVRNRPNTMNVGEAVEICYNLPFLRVENHELISVHVGDVETTVRGVETLIVEANRWAWQRHVRDLLQWCRFWVLGWEASEWIHIHLVFRQTSVYCLHAAPNESSCPTRVDSPVPLCFESSDVRAKVRTCRHRQRGPCGTYCRSRPGRTFASTRRHAWRSCLDTSVTDHRLQAERTVRRTARDGTNGSKSAVYAE